MLVNTNMFLNRALIYNPLLMETLYKFDKIAEVIKISLIDIDIFEIQKLTYNLILDLSIKLDLHSGLV